MIGSLEQVRAAITGLLPRLRRFARTLTVDHSAADDLVEAGAAQDDLADHRDAQLGQPGRGGTMHVGVREPVPGVDGEGYQTRRPPGQTRRPRAAGPHAGHVLSPNADPGPGISKRTKRDRRRQVLQEQAGIYGGAIDGVDRASGDPEPQSTCAARRINPGATIGRDVQGKVGRAFDAIDLT